MEPVNHQPPRSGCIARVRVAGIPLFIHRSFPVGGLLVVVFLGDFSPVAVLSAIAAYTTLVAVHELGHAAFARRAGVEVHALVVTATGGLCVCDPPSTAFDQLLIASGGLLAQLVVFGLTLSFIAWSGDITSPIANGVVVVFTLCNAIFFLGNLIPYRYNDGSMILEALRDLRRRGSV
jgi:Zn-dependent protease